MITNELKTKKDMYPALDIQKQFSIFITQTVQQKLSLHQSLAQLETLKKALMQKCFG